MGSALLSGDPGHKPWHPVRAGGLRSELAVLEVRSCQPRLGLAAVALGGALLAGRPNALGLALLPLHARLARARLCLSTAQPGEGAHSLMKPYTTSETPMPASEAHPRARADPAASVRLEVPCGQPAVLVPLAGGGGTGAAGEAAALRTVACGGRGGDAMLQAGPSTSVQAALCCMHCATSCACPSAASLLWCSKHTLGNQTRLHWDLSSQTPSAMWAVGLQGLQHSMAQRIMPVTCAQARGSQWVALAVEGGGAELPTWAASQPSLLWLHVHASAPCAWLAMLDYQQGHRYQGGCLDMSSEPPWQSAFDGSQLCSPCDFEHRPGSWQQQPQACFAGGWRELVMQSKL